MMLLSIIGLHIQWNPHVSRQARRGTPLIGAVGWKFVILQLKSTPRIGAAFAYWSTSNRICFHVEHIFVPENLVFRPCKLNNLFLIPVRANFLPPSGYILCFFIEYLILVKKNQYCSYCILNIKY